MKVSSRTPQQYSSTVIYFQTCEKYLFWEDDFFFKLYSNLQNIYGYWTIIMWYRRGQRLLATEGHKEYKCVVEHSAVLNT